MKLRAVTRGGSGGYAEFILRNAPYRLLGVNNTNNNNDINDRAKRCRIEWTQQRNKDSRVGTLFDEHNNVLLRVGKERKVESLFVYEKYVFNSNNVWFKKYANIGN